MCEIACTFTAVTTSSAKAWPKPNSQNARVRSADLGLKAAVAGLLLGLVLASLNPYRGALSVSVAPLAEALSAMKARR